MKNNKLKNRSFFHQFKIDGRKSWGKYLEVERANALGKKNKRKYLKYIEDQIVYNNKILDRLTK